MKTKRQTSSKQWLKRHGFTNGLWRLEEHEQSIKRAKERNAHVARPFRQIVNSFTPHLAE